MPQPGLRGRGCAQRAVVDVQRVKRNAHYINYVLTLECGHKAYRHLWRDCSHVGCKDCSEALRVQAPVH